MKLKTLPKRTLLIFVITGFALSLALLFYFILKSPFHSSSEPLIENTATLPKQEEITSGLPVRLRIPGINVDSAFEYVGLTPDGAMDVPKDPADVAWFEPGSRPGDKGSAVVAGHYGWKDGTSVFDNLHKLRKGDKLYVEDDKGVIIAFVVRESRSYDPKADASDVFGSSDGKSHLNLVTCEGVWDEATQSYPKRLVVFTDKEGGN